MCRETVFPVRAIGLLAAVALTVLAGCKASDRAVFLTFVGEAPTDRTLFTEFAGAQRLGRQPPGIPTTRYPPSISPDTRREDGSSMMHAYDRVRQALSDRDDEFQFRRQSLTLFVAAYLKAASELDLAAGDPLPNPDAAFEADMKAARAALNEIEGDVFKLNKLVVLIQRDLEAARSVAARALERNSVLATVASASINTAENLVAAVSEVAAEYVEYIDGQRDALSRLEAQVVKATGADNVWAIQSRDTLIE